MVGVPPLTSEIGCFIKLIPNYEEVSVVYFKENKINIKQKVTQQRCDYWTDVSYLRRHFQNDFKITEFKRWKITGEVILIKNITRNF